MHQSGFSIFFRRFSYAPLLIAILLLSFVLFGCLKKDQPCISCPSPGTDTTSHLFQIVRIDTLGNLFSFARCVDIVSDSSIWVGGTFSELDTTGYLVNKKNFAHWDGRKWTQVEVPVTGYNGVVSFQEIISIKAFSEKSVFAVSVANSFVRWNGIAWKSFYGTPAPIEHLWARSETDAYFAGGYGSVTWYDGNAFTKSPLGLAKPPFLDIWGDESKAYAVGIGSTPAEGTGVVIAAGTKADWNVFLSYDITDPNAQNRPDYVGGALSIYRAHSMAALWLLGGGGSGQVFAINSLSPFRAREVYHLPTWFYPFMIRGTADNDLYVLDQRNGIFCHFNGISWNQFVPGISDFITMGFAVRGNTWVCVGAGSGDGVGRAIVIRGKHL